MRNLKRALSLAMASIMILGMMVMSASAVSYSDFSDKDKVVNTEAVSILVELGVISGRDDGTFDPTGVVTRAEMAKMICVMLNGGRDPQLGGASSNTYTDTVGHWAAAYIEYCTNLNIVTGRGNGMFDPNATVTGEEAAKMLLAAAGYQAAIEGFTGANWAISTNVSANRVGIYNGLTLNPPSGVTRDNAAQMVFNCLSVNVVTYKYTMAPDGKGGVISVPERVETEANDSTKKLPTVLQSKFGAVKVEGVVTGNEIGSVGGNKQDAGVTTIAITNGDEQNKILSGKFNMSTGADVLGHSVVFYAKPGATTSANKATVVGSPMISEDNTVVTLSSGSTTKTIEKRASDEDLKFTGNTKFITNYTESSKFSKTDYTVNGVEIALIDNDNDGDIDFALQNFEVFGKVGAYSTKDKGSMTVNAVSLKDGYGFYNDAAAKENYTSSSIKMDKSENVIGFEDVSKDDYVFAQEICGKLYVREAESLELTPTSTKGNDFIADGTTYKQAGTVFNVVGNKTSEATLAASVTVGTTGKVYVDQYDYVVLVSDVETTLRYLYVTNSDVNDFLSNAQAKVVLSDGTTSTVTVSKVNGSDPTKATLTNGTVYTYTTTSNGQYKLTAISGDKAAVKTIAPVDNKTEESLIKKGNATLSNTGFIANSSTVFVVKNSSSWSVYTGISNVPTLKSVTNGANPATYSFDAKVAAENNIAKVVFVSNSSLGTSTDLSKSVYFLNKNPEITKDSNGDNVYSYSVLYKGENVNLKADDNLGLKNSGLYLECKMDANDMITSIGTHFAGSTASTAENGVLVLNTAVAGYGRTFTVNSNTKVIAIDGEDFSDVDLGYITVNSDVISVIPDKDNTTLAAYIFVQE